MEKIRKKIEFNPKRIEEIENKFNTEYLSKTKALLERILLFLENSDNKDLDELKKQGYLGHGGAGIVISVNSDTCLKIMDNRVMLSDEENDKEALILEKLNGFRTGNVKTPLFYFYYRADKKREFFMEKIKGANLKRILDGHEKIPRAFYEKYSENGEINWRKVFDDIEEFIDEMHYQKGIIHNDLALRNIMIGEDGMIYIIDFGASFSTYNLTESERRKKEEKDFEDLEKAFEEINDKNNVFEISDEYQVDNLNRYNLDASEIVFKIINDSILKEAREFIEKNNSCGEFRPGLLVSDKKEDFNFGFKILIIDGKKYYVGII